MRRDASRCVFCYDAPCRQVCPAGIDVPCFIRCLQEDNVKGAGELIFQENVLGATCARVCPVEELCEGRCVLKDWTGKAVPIAKLQKYAADWFLSKQLALTPAKTSAARTEKVAVVGAGPAGLSCAYTLAQQGFSVELYEKEPVAGGLATLAIAPFKISTEIVNQEIKLVRKSGVKLILNTPVGKQLTFGELRNKYGALFLGLGLNETSTINLPGRDLAGVMNALDFLRAAKGAKKMKPGRNVVIIGGGNTALDAAIIAKMLGAEHVAVLYRRSENEMRGYRSELDMARLRDCWFYWQTQPLRLLGKKNVAAVEYVQTKLGRPDASGRRRPLPIMGKRFLLEADLVLLALGQHLQCAILEQLPGLQITENSLIKINKRTGETSLKGVFAGGDCVTGGGNVVDAVAAGKLAARAIASKLTHSRAQGS